MKSLTNETLSIGEGNLIDKNITIITNWKNISATRTDMDLGQLLQVYIESLLNNIIKRRVKYFQAALVSSGNDGINIPLTC